MNVVPRACAESRNVGRIGDFYVFRIALGEGYVAVFEVVQSGVVGGDSAVRIGVFKLFGQKALRRLDGADDASVHGFAVASC